MSDFDEMVIATHNPGKAREIAALLEPYIKTFYSAADFDLPEPVEDGGSFVENALIKARSAVKHSGKLSLADDSGLAVNALGGDPGIYSARWAKGNKDSEKDFNVAMGKVHEALGDSDDRSAYFVCVLALAWPDGRMKTFEGRVNGQISWPPRGARGFGYDPVFVADGHDVTFAEMEPQTKHAISHRADAFKKLVDECF